jgi:hydrogenase maturation protein HypF
MIVRMRIVARGLVQGVGFRPAIARAATERGFSGWVRNTKNGAETEVQGPDAAIAAFLGDFPSLLPEAAVLDSLEHGEIPLHSLEPGFGIVPSEDEGPSRFSVPPDLAMCPDCEREFLDPTNRRYLYPFISCGECGPRYTYMVDMPYDRRNTAMAPFPLCDKCRAEYEDPSDRRYHIEGFCCPDCGPLLKGFEEGISVLLSGGIAAIKGIGGYHLACLADETDPVASLRAKKARPRKPLAVMYPDLVALERAVELLPLEKRALASAEAPIVLIPKKRFRALPDPGIAPGNSSIGVFIPYSPLHKSLLRWISRPIALTSANLPGDPLVIDDKVAEEGLSGIASVIIGHDRKILKRADDGVLFVASGRIMPMRKGRGSAPRPIRLPYPSPLPILALGAELKSTITVVRGEDLATSPHIGDLESFSTFEHFRKTVSDMLDYYGVEPALIVVDLHPGYESTRFGMELARERGLPFLQVQHHHAHLLSILLDTGRLENMKASLGLVLDGTGLGSDGSLWGGEFLLVRGESFERVGHLSHIRLSGGEAAIWEPWRIAAGLGILRYIPEGRSAGDVANAQRIAQDSSLSPATSSCGRLFDAAAAVLGFDRRIGFEGEAAMWLESIASEAEQPAELHKFAALDGKALLGHLAERISERKLDPRRMDRDDLAAFALGFHRALAENIVEESITLARRFDLHELVLSGGVFQNRILLEAVITGLEWQGLAVVTGERVPANDGGISVGQAAAGILAARSQRRFQCV